VAVSVGVLSFGTDCVLMDTASLPGRLGGRENPPICSRAWTLELHPLEHQKQKTGKNVKTTVDQACIFHIIFWGDGSVGILTFTGEEGGTNKPKNV